MASALIDWSIHVHIFLFKNHSLSILVYPSCIAASRFNIGIAPWASSEC